MLFIFIFTFFNFQLCYSSFLYSDDIEHIQVDYILYTQLYVMNMSSLYVLQKKKKVKN